MQMAKARVQAGACGFTVDVTVTRLDNRRVRVTLDTPCEKVTAMETELQALRCLGREHEVFLPFDRSIIYEAATKHSLHTACPVPAAILKAIEVELGIAVPRDVVIEIMPASDEDSE
jgi:hypothetical protein